MPTDSPKSSLAQSCACVSPMPNLQTEVPGEQVMEAGRNGSPKPPRLLKLLSLSSCIMRGNVQIPGCGLVEDPPNQESARF